MSSQSLNKALLENYLIINMMTKEERIEMRGLSQKLRHIMIVG